jgi:DNA-nicking Smr family endonuclease
MKDPKKGKKSLNKQKDKMSGVVFELEENAEDLFLEHVLNVKPSQKDTDNQEIRQGEKLSAVMTSRVLDLHGLSLEEACELIRNRSFEWMQVHGKVRVKIITGKGHGSQGRVGILAREVHSWVIRELSPWIVEIEKSPASEKVKGVPLRGHFNVVFSGKNK